MRVSVKRVKLEINGETRVLLFIRLCIYFRSFLNVGCSYVPVCRAYIRVYRTTCLNDFLVTSTFRFKNIDTAVQHLRTEYSITRPRRTRTVPETDVSKGLPLLCPSGFSSFWFRKTTPRERTNANEPPVRRKRDTRVTRSRRAVATWPRRRWTGERAGRRCARATFVSGNLVAVDGRWRLGDDDGGRGVRPHAKVRDGRAKTVSWPSTIRVRIGLESLSHRDEHWKHWGYKRSYHLSIWKLRTSAQEHR